MPSRYRNDPQQPSAGGYATHDAAHPLVESTPEVPTPRPEHAALGRPLWRDRHPRPTVEVQHGTVRHVVLDGDDIEITLHIAIDVRRRPRESATSG